jgi:opacity protein-like surface antigen
MNRISFVAAAVAILGSAAVASANAQSIAGTPIQFGVMGGVTKPVGDIAYNTRHDWNLGALVLIGSPQSRLNFRVDGQWQQLAGVQPITGMIVNCLGCQSSNQQSAQSYRVLDLTTNAVFDFVPTSPTSFYLVGGVGAYNARQRDPASGESASVTRFGLNAGAGVRFRLGNLQPFVEARYHDIIGAHSFAAGPLAYGRSQTFQFVLIKLGVVF